MSVPPSKPKINPPHTVTQEIPKTENSDFLKKMTSVVLPLIASFGATLASFIVTERTITGKTNVILGTTIASILALVALGLMSFAVAQAMSSSPKTKPAAKPAKPQALKVQPPEKVTLKPEVKVEEIKAQLPSIVEKPFVPIYMSPLQPSIHVKAADTNKAPEPKKQNDIVCEFSQGRLTDVRNAIGIINNDDDNLGSLACAVICMKATLSFLEKGVPKTDKEMYSLIDQGVSFYKEKRFSGTVLFADVLNMLKPIERQKLEIIEPKEKDVSASALSESSFIPLAYTDEHELTADVNIYLDRTLNYLSKKANERDQKTCAILTTSPANGATNATVVIMFDENKKPVLFNSHGQTYQGESKGASLLKFENMNQLNKYIKETLCYGVGGSFQFQVLGNAT